MDILIKGMEMPKNCLSCPMKEHCQLFNALHFNERLKMLDESIRVDGCPLVALPSHGRLGDLDALKNSVADMRMEKPLRNGAKQVIEIGELFGRIIDDAPTILEANNGSDN